MSDCILKFWPKEEVKEIKTEQIKKGLHDSKIIDEPKELWGEQGYEAGSAMNDYFEPVLNPEWAKQYFPTIALMIEEKGYGVESGEEDFEYVDRLNVVSIKGGEGAFDSWNKMCAELEKITGDKYQGGWELL
ncbi:hypothetical protein [Aestuariibaculum marinum]|uniref:Uncharacterized protein n=1 Tax=Aestuariibaculum marinum TaxID=2683592 RepID=A0A8J6Q6X3_9FLAO|nr:hypothetical protein [Aestuariibaculum marinum]MBD0822711.1 hypothetical protein [Aestuariibaculum marinum]